MSDYKMWFYLKKQTKISILLVSANIGELELNGLVFQDNIAKMNYTLEDARTGARDVREDAGVKTTLSQYLQVHICGDRYTRITERNTKRSRS